MRKEFIQICYKCKKPFKWYGYEGWEKKTPVQMCYKCYKSSVDNLMKLLNKND